MILLTQPDNTCLIPKDSELDIKFESTDIIETVGTIPSIITNWFPSDIGATGVFLSKDIALGVNNQGNEFDGTFAGFVDLAKRCFPELYNATFTQITFGSPTIVLIQLPNEGELENFVFSPDVLTLGNIASTAVNGTNTTLKECKYEITLIDEDNNPLDCKIETQYPKLENGVIVPNCISNWNVSQSTTIPENNSTNQIDSEFCKRFKYVIREYCRNDSTCGYSVSNIIETEYFSVVNSVTPKYTDFSKYCVVGQFLLGEEACNLTNINCKELCFGQSAYLWFCPNLFQLDEGSTTYIAQYVNYDSDGNIISTVDSLLGSSNTTYVTPLDLYPANTSYFTIQYQLIFNGNTFDLTEPTRYNLKPCKKGTLVLYFQEQLGGYSSICFKCIKKKNISNTSVKTCNKNGVSDVAHTAVKSYEIESEFCNPQLLETFLLATKHYIIENGDNVKVSIKDKVQTYDEKDNLEKINLTIEFKDCTLNG